MADRTSVSIRLRRGAILKLQTDTADRLAGQAAQTVQARARRYAPKKTGRLAESIRVRKVTYGTRVTYSIGSDLEYAAYQEWGTGPIYPLRPGGVLRFEVGGTIVFARRTKGVPATHFMRRAGHKITITDFIT